MDKQLPSMTRKASFPFPAHPMLNPIHPTKHDSCHPIDAASSGCLADKPGLPSDPALIYTTSHNCLPAACSSLSSVGILLFLIPSTSTFVQISRIYDPSPSKSISRPEWLRPSQWHQSRRDQWARGGNVLAAHCGRKTRPSRERRGPGIVRA